MKSLVNLGDTGAEQCEEAGEKRHGDKVTSVGACVSK